MRPYTPVSQPDAPGELALLVKKYDAGNASKHIHDLKVGDTLGIKGPIAKFPYKGAWAAFAHRRGDAARAGGVARVGADGGS